MAAVGPRGSRRGALVSVPRGARSLAINAKRNSVLVGTCIASGGNELHSLVHSAGADALSPEATYECDEEIWGICALEDQGQSPVCAVALRERGQSSLHIWRLSACADQAGAGPLLETPGLPKLQPERLCSSSVAVGKARCAQRYMDDGVLLCASNAAAIYRVDAGRSDLQQVTAVTPPGGSSGDSSVVCADYCASVSAVLLATRGSLTLHDTRSPSPSDATVLLRNEDKQAWAAKGGGAGYAGNGPPRRGCLGLGLRPRRLRISAAAGGAGHVVGAGDEDGDVYAADVRLAGGAGGRLLWHAPDTAAHAHWVTSVAVGPDEAVASGSSDGVVRIWSGGQPVGTYPIHDETVYGTAWLAGDVGFASLSYDGRLAINPRPIGST